MDKNDTFAMKCLDLNIKLLKESIEPEMISKVKEVIKKFDGKTYSKRFDNALKAVNENLHVYYHFNSFWIKVNFVGRNSISKTAEEGYGCYYTDNDRIIMAGCESSSYDDEVLDDHYGIKADTMLKLLDYGVQCIKDDITEYETKKSKIEEFRTRAAEIKKLSEELSNDCPPLFGQLFDIKRYWTGQK